MKQRLTYTKKDQNKSIFMEGNKKQNQKTKVRVSGLDHAHPWTSLHVYNPAYMRKQDYVHVGSAIETLAKSTATQKTK